MQLGSYRVLRPFAEDSLGETFLATDGDLQLLVRVLGPEQVADPQVDERLRPLLPPQVALSSPGRGTGVGLFRQPDRSALWVTPLPEGYLLTDLLTQHAGLAEHRGTGSFTPLLGALAIAHRLAELLATAHASGSSHLRLGPAQVFVTISKDAKPSVSVVLRDIGLLTTLGPVAATASRKPAPASPYLAPEQRLESNKAVDVNVLGGAPSDVYALGVLLVQLLTGQLPGQPQWQAALAHLKSGAVSKDLSALIDGMLAAEPSRRPQMKQVEAVLRTAVATTESAPLQAQLQAYQGTLAGPIDGTPPPHTQVADYEASPVVSVRNEPINQVMGNFRLLRKLGEGGMGVVYEAEHQQIGRRAAVKILHKEFAHSPDFAKRFLNEARAVNIIRHPSLVEIFEYGQQPDGTLYIVMEFLEGESLHKRIQTPGARLPQATVAEIGVQIARALAKAHEKEIVHRDLKPENVMLVPDPVRAGQERVKILDFGIAKLQRNTPEPSAASGGKTAMGSVMGTPLYMAPEQFGSAESVDGSADVFSLGVILYELLGGRRPYEGESFNVLTRPSGPLHKVNPNTQPQIAELVMEMISPSAPRRPTMRQVAERLLPFTQTAPSRQSPLRYILLASIVAVAISTLLFVLLQRKSALTAAQARQIALKAIQAGLQSKAKEERLLAVQALGMSRDPAELELLTPLLADPAVVGSAARALGNLGAVAAQPALLLLVDKAPDNQVRLEAATALAQLANPTGTTTLRALLSQTDGVIQVESALRLLEQNDLTGAALLHRLTDSSTAPLPRVLPVLAALARAGDDDARQRLAQLAADSPTADPLLLYTLAQRGDAAAVGKLVGLAEQAGTEQVLAARFLASLGQDTGYDVLLHKSLDTKQPDAVREIAIEGLGDRGRFDAAAPLATVVQAAESKRLRLTAAGAILRLAAGEPSRLAEQSLSWSRVALSSDSAAMRELAVGLLNDVESDAAVSPLRQALRDGEREVRYHAVKALGRRHVRAALEALGDALEDADSEVRTTCMRSIGQVAAALRRRGDRDADPLVQKQLQKLAHGGEEIDRVVASGILLQTGDATQQEVLRGGLRSRSALVRRLAIEVMLQDVPLLSAGLSDPDRLVRLAAARRLADGGSAEVKAVLRELAMSSDEAGLSAYGLLHKLGESVPEPPKITTQLKKGSLRERTAVVELLPELPPALALRLLLIASIDEFPLIRQRAADAAYELASKTGQPEFSRLLLSLRSDSSLAVRMAVSELAARLPKAALAAAASGHKSPLSASSLPAAAPSPAPAVVEPAPPTAASPAAESGGVEAKVQTLLSDVRAAIRSKKYSRAQSALNRARKLLHHKGSKSVLPSEILYLQGTVYELSGKWRQAMETYFRYEEVPQPLRVAESAQAVTAAVARLKARMGKVQIYTLSGGKCQVTEEYYLPAGDHIISLGSGQTKTVSVDVGVTTPVRQCQ